MQTEPIEKLEKLFTPNFILACIANFCMFFAFYLIMPAMPVYLLAEFKSNKAIVGMVLSSYTIATLMVRPFAGFIADTFQRKPFYIISFFLFIASFAGYMLASSLLVMTIIRATHGFTYGMVTTASTTFSLDVMPSSRRGTGIGYFGSTSTLAMALGPMVGLFFVETNSFTTVFLISIISGLIGLILASFIKVEKREIKKREAISLDRFLLLKAIVPASVLFFITFPYGIITTYIALLGREVGINTGVGKFFIFYSIGLIAARFGSGKIIDKGYLTQLILVGNFIIVATIAIFVLITNVYVFFGIALIFGIGIGLIAPAYQMLFINLAEHNKRGTANSTYLISWDVGIGLSVLLGGQIAEVYSYHFACVIGLILAILSSLLFLKITIPYYKKNRLY